MTQYIAGNIRARMVACRIMPGVVRNHNRHAQLVKLATAFDTLLCYTPSQQQWFLVSRVHKDEQRALRLQWDVVRAVPVASIDVGRAMLHMGFEPEAPPVVTQVTTPPI